MARGVRFPPAMAMMRETTLSMFPEKNAFVQRTYLNLVKHKHKSQPDNVHINNAEKLNKKRISFENIQELRSKYYGHTIAR
jgi:hypothetical protein